MKTRRGTWSAFILILAAAGALYASPAADVSGTWEGVLTDPEGHTGNVRFVLKQADGQITGNAGPSEKQTLPAIYDGKLDGSHLTFSVDDHDDNGLQLTYRMDLTVIGDRLVGKANGRSGDRSWIANLRLKRQK